MNKISAYEVLHSNFYCFTCLFVFCLPVLVAVGSRIRALEGKFGLALLVGPRDRVLQLL